MKPHDIQFAIKGPVKTLCDRHIEDRDLDPRVDGLPHCNHFVQRIFKDAGYPMFNTRQTDQANEIHQYCASHNQEFEKIETWQIETTLAADHLILATRQGEPHGHVAIVYPAPFIMSGKYDRLVPIVAHAGDEGVDICGTNFAFREKKMPDFWLFKYRLSEVVPRPENHV